MGAWFAVGICALILAAFVSRLAILSSAACLKRRCDQSVKTMIVLGSGGHTAEMLSLVRRMHGLRYTPLIFVMAATDRMSAARAATLLKSRSLEACGRSGVPQALQLESIPRSREVGQSYLTSVATTSTALLTALQILWRHHPDLLLVNGPGTCIPVCVAALLCRLFGLCTTRIVYIESIARVRTLSLSGAILYHCRIASAFYVQWPVLQSRYPRAVFRGRLY